MKEGQFWIQLTHHSGSITNQDNEYLFSPLIPLRQLSWIQTVQRKKQTVVL